MVQTAAIVTAAPRGASLGALRAPRDLSRHRGPEVRTVHQDPAAPGNGAAQTSDRRPKGKDCLRGTTRKVNVSSGTSASTCTPCQVHLELLEAARIPRDIRKGRKTRVGQDQKTPRARRRTGRRTRTTRQRPLFRYRPRPRVRVLGLPLEWSPLLLQLRSCFRGRRLRRVNFFLCQRKLHNPVIIKLGAARSAMHALGKGKLFAGTRTRTTGSG